MPRPGPRKLQASWRIHPDDLKRLDLEAAANGKTRTQEIIRRMDWAGRTIPEDYEVGAKIPKRILRAGKE